MQRDRCFRRDGNHREVSKENGEVNSEVNNEVNSEVSIAVESTGILSMIEESTLTTPNPRPTGSWQPLLTGEAAARAWQSIHEVAAALSQNPTAPASERAAGLAGGSAGIALFFAYLAAAVDDEAHADRALAYLDQAIEDLAQQPMSASLYSGFTGISWTAQHLSGRLFAADPAADEDHEIDAALLTLLDQETWTTDYDLIGGLAGFAVHALEALPRKTARHCLEQVLTQLERLAVRSPQGISWFTAPHLLPAYQREMCPQGYFNLGLAHGVPAVIAVLALAVAAGVAEPRIEPLLAAAVDWLLAQELDDNRGFPSWVGEGYIPQPSRLAWCYGDLGLTAALFLAARAAGQTRWEAEALRIARRAAVRPSDTAGVRDVGLCHGAAGLGHLFNRLYQASGDASLAAAARFWFAETLNLRRPNEGIAGYLSFAPSDPGEQQWLADPGFLTGAAGAALALLAAVSPQEPAWDRVLLCSIPPGYGSAENEF